MPDAQFAIDWMANTHGSHFFLERVGLIACIHHNVKEVIDSCDKDDPTCLTFSMPRTGNAEEGSADNRPDKARGAKA